MVTAKLETERKYDADLAGALPPLADLPQVSAESDPEEFRLEAEYYDTPDLRLLQAGITLRRRRGGTDFGWHLKLPAGPDTRQELQLPLGRGRAVPAELARLVRVHARRLPLAPVARIVTVRRQRDLLDEAGTSLAEVVDDQVSAQSLGTETALLQWREVEVELTGGGRPLLRAVDDRLRGAGLRPAGRSAKLQRVLADRLPPPAASRPLTRKSAAGDVVLAYLREQVRALTSADPLARRQAPDAVHQMRVTTRRLRATLKTFSSVLEPAATAGLRAELQWIGAALGAERDSEVLAAHLAGLLAETPPELILGPVRAQLTEHFAPRGAAAHRALLRALDSGRYLALLDQLDLLLAEPPLTLAAAGPAGEVLDAAVSRAFRRLRRRARRTWTAPGPLEDDALHQTRKAAKAARYAADLMAPVAGRPAAQFAEQMKKVQSVLGDHQDTVMARAAIRQLGVAAHLGGDNAFTFGLLYGRDADAALILQDEALLAFEEAAQPRYRRWLRS